MGGGSFAGIQGIMPFGVGGAIGGLASVLGWIYSGQNLYDVGSGTSELGNQAGGYPQFSLGPGDFGGVSTAPVPSVPQMVSAPADIYETATYSEPYYPDLMQPYPQTIPNITLDPVETQGSQTINWDGSLFDMFPGINPSGDNDMSLDLGGLLSQAIGAIAQYQMAGQNTGYSGPVQIPVAGNPLIPDFLEDAFGGSPPPGLIPNSSLVPCKKRKRRRRRLATPSDIKDLAALKAVTTPAEMKTWIATHPS